MNKKSKISTEQRLENAIKNRPDNYITKRDSDNKIVSVADKDSGRLWHRLEDKKHFMWID